MAKSKFKVPKIKKDDGAIKEEVTHIPQYYDNLEKSVKPEIVVEPDSNEQIVIGSASAEIIQKQGWQLIDCHLNSDGKKEYKFRKV